MDGGTSTEGEEVGSVRRDNLRGVYVMLSLGFHHGVWSLGFVYYLYSSFEEPDWFYV